MGRNGGQQVGDDRGGAHLVASLRALSPAGSGQAGERAGVSLQDGKQQVAGGCILEGRGGRRISLLP